ncbi:hypothetical protein [Sorangium sp. So ce1389]|uniref:hypothetical protein n=1 Tax=Sorangium sp. So ce1389 TaxID=3133336 RepID=UPI003F63D4AE
MTTYDSLSNELIMMTFSHLSDYEVFEARRTSRRHHDCAMEEFKRRENQEAWGDGVNHRKMGLQTLVKILEVGITSDLYRLTLEEQVALGFPIIVKEKWCWLF